MIAYAIRNGINDVFLFYPKPIKREDAKLRHEEKLTCFKVIDGLCGNKEIHIYVDQLPILSDDLITNSSFEQTKDILKTHLEDIFKRVKQ